MASRKRWMGEIATLVQHRGLVSVRLGKPWVVAGTLDPYRIPWPTFERLQEKGYLRPAGRGDDGGLVYLPTEDAHTFVGLQYP